MLSERFALPAARTTRSTARNLWRAWFLLAILIGPLGACAVRTNDASHGVTATEAADTTGGTETHSSTLPPVGEVVDRLALRLGDCLNRYDSLELITRLPCAVAHDGEVFYSELHPAPINDPFPGETEMERYANRACHRVFESFVGVPYEISTLGIGVIAPSRAGFEDVRTRARVIICYVTGRHDEKLVGTMRGSRT